MAISYGAGARTEQSPEEPPEKDFWDVAEQASRNSHVLSDWEGMSDPARALALLEHPIVDEAFTMVHSNNSAASEADDGRFSGVDVVFIQDIVLHWLHENLDQADYTPNPEEIANFIQQLEWLFSCRFWMRSSA